MSWEGFKKQFNKANQYMSEKIGGAKGTELDEEFVEMERKIDVMGKLIDDLIGKTQEFLQPNPASRTKMMVVNNFSKVRGTTKNVSYPQPEGTLGEHMIKHGKDLGEEMMFGECLQEAGEVFKQLADTSMPWRTMSNRTSWDLWQISSPRTSRRSITTERSCLAEDWTLTVRKERKTKERLVENPQGQM